MPENRSVDGRRYISFISFLAAALLLAACGGSSDDEASADQTTDQTASDSAAADEDHDDEEHDDHGDEDHEGDDEDHDDHGGEGLGAHEHGVAELTVAWSGSDMVIDLTTPTYNIFGFEAEPAGDDEQAIVDEKIEALSASEVIAINDEAGCEPADDVITDLDYDDGHAELTASWLLVCQSPDDITTLDAAGLFAAMDNLETLDVQWASESTQSAAELTPSTTDVELG